MVESRYWFDEPIRWKSIGSFVQRCNEVLGRNALITGGNEGSVSYLDGYDLTSAELATIKDVNRRFDVLDSWETSKLRNLTITDVENWIATVQAQINAISDLKTAKTALNSTYTITKIMARIIIWLLKREMQEI